MWWDSQDQDWETGVRQGAGQTVQGITWSLLGLCPEGRRGAPWVVFVRRPAWSWVRRAPHGSFRKPGQLVRGSGHTCAELGVRPWPEWTCGQSV